MARKPTGNPVGRPEKEIDWQMFEQLCGIQCTQSEICSFLKINDDTLRTRVLNYYGDEYSNIYKKYAETGKCSLRRYQFALAKKNTAMAIWLGKQYLGQKDEAHDVKIDAKTIEFLEKFNAYLDSSRKSCDSTNIKE